MMMDLTKWPVRISRKALINRNGLIVQKKSQKSDHGGVEYSFLKSAVSNYAMVRF